MMEAYLLRSDQIAASLGRPEAGMGYQEASLERRNGYIVSSKVFVPIGTIARGTSRDDPQYYTKGLAVQAPNPKHELHGSLSIPTAVGRYFATGLAARIGATSVVVSSTLPDNEARTEEGDEFFRLFAYAGDKRITEHNGLAPGSYATTSTDMTVVPSGLAAVGRFALPTRISARYVFRITPGKGVRIFYGTVIPNYGLCGGGVEVFFPDGTGPHTVDIRPPIPEK
jgi:hypothetical protein